MSAMTFDEKWNERKKGYDLNESDNNLASEFWHARDEEVSALQRQLEPSPCGVEGHRRADWVEKSTKSCEGVFEPAYCQRCHDEQEILRGRLEQAWEALKNEQDCGFAISAELEVLREKVKAGDRLARTVGSITVCDMPWNAHHLLTEALEAYRALPGVK